MRTLSISILFAGAIFITPVTHAQVTSTNAPTAEPSPAVTTTAPKPDTSARQEAPIEAAAVTAAPVATADQSVDKPAEKPPAAVTATSSATPEQTATAQPSAVPPPAVAAEPVKATPVVAPTPLPTAEILARLNLIENAMLAQRDREMDLFRDTNRTVLYFGVTCLGIGLVAFIASVFLANRSISTVNESPARLQLGGVAGLPVPVSTHQGMERVHASGQRFQSRMSSLEHRLADLEDMAGGKDGGGNPVTDTEPTPNDDGSQTAETVASEPRRVIPRASILVHKAQTQMSLGRYNDAMNTIEEALAIEPENSEVQLARGQVLEKLGRSADALRAYEDAVSLDDSNANALLLKAGLLNRQERYDEALLCYERALEVHRAHA